MSKYFVSIFLAAVMLSAVSPSHKAHAFTNTGCDGDCKKCHTLSNQEVGDILNKLKIPNAKILGIQASPVKSLWEISIEESGRRGLLYIDFSKSHIVSGQIIDVNTGSNKTQESFEKIQVKKQVDVSKIPLENALVMGDGKAAKRVIIFTDPDCPFCGKLHQEMKKVVETRKDIVFFIKLYPLPFHKESPWKSKSITCKKSLAMLEDNFEQKEIPKEECSTSEIDDNIKLAGALEITGTPAIILPDGVVLSGAMPAEKLIELIDGRK